MSDTAPPALDPTVVKAREDIENQVTLEIARPPDGQSLSIFIKAPLVAEVIKSMTPSNYELAKYQPIYRPILKEVEGNPKLAITRAAIARATRNFVGGVDFSFSEPPRSILLANPEALIAGFTLVYKVESPVPYDLLKKWGKQFMLGCDEIITNAKPFRMSWVMNKMD